MSYFNKKRFTMRQVVGLLTVVFLGITAFAYAVNITYTFSSGSPIRASEMNQNFTDIKNAVDTLESKVTTLEGKAATLESKVAALEAKDADLVTANDLSGTRWSGFIYNGQGTATSVFYIIFIDSQNMSMGIAAADSETGSPSGIQVDYTNCRYRVGNINRSVVGTVSLGCNLGVLTDVRINRPYNNRITGSVFIGNSTLNADHPKLSHGDFYLDKF